jgi:hypothetical protein
MTAKRDKIAIVIVHGMGEQRPMETLRGFVGAAWSEDRDVISQGESAVYAKPDEINRSFELRRITTRTSHQLHGRCDFFEYYWANLMSGNRASSVVRWLVALLVRRPASVPARLVKHWLFGLTLLILIGLGLAYLALLGLAKEWDRAQCLLDWLQGLHLPFWLVPLAVGLAVLVRYLMPGVFAPVVGDAARYFTPAPDNIGARQAIREAGVDLMRRLHEDGDYKRIILVAHSLGAAVGYDILTHLWARIDPDSLGTAHASGSDTAKALAAVEEAAGPLAPDRIAGAGEAERARRRAAYRNRQRAYFARLAQPPLGSGSPLWMVSDFVTMGSPLSKADVLVAHDQGKLKRMIGDRESPTCPPEPDGEGSAAFSYHRPGAPGPVPHHASPFGPTVWTNLYFTNPGILFGDVVGGETAPRLGHGIADVRIERGRALFRHLDYWSAPKRTPPPAPWIKALRAALNLRLRGEAELWGPAAAQAPIRAEDVPDRGGAAGG